MWFIMSGRFAENQIEMLQVECSHKSKDTVMVELLIKIIIKNSLDIRIIECPILFNNLGRNVSVLIETYAINNLK